ncbi:T9SS type A sorting domain-containing protein [Polaribacter sp.]|nr:T9SS type A sorting domain-containing protein [Polaribacter sp.]
MHANISIYTINENSIRIVGVQNGAAKVRVYSMLGKQLHTTSFQGNGMNDVDLPKVAKGVYLIQLETEIGILNKKIIIE